MNIHQAVNITILVGRLVEACDALRVAAKADDEDATCRHFETIVTIAKEITAYEKGTK